MGCGELEVYHSVQLDQTCLLYECWKNKTDIGEHDNMLWNFRYNGLINCFVIATKNENWCVLLFCLVGAAAVDSDR